MLSPTQYIATYSEKGTGRGNSSSIPEILDTVKSWLLDARHIIISEREKIEKMKSIQVNAEQIFILIGMLTALRVKCDTHETEIKENRVYPLNQAQISKFTESLLLKHHRNNAISVWDIYNAATDLYKADSMNIPSLLPQNRAMVTFLNEQFNFSND